MKKSTRSPHALTIADLRARLAELPDWAIVQVTTWDEMDCPEENDPYLHYSSGVLTIDAA